MNLSYYQYDRIHLRLLGAGARHFNLREGSEICGEILLRDGASIRIRYNGFEMQLEHDEYETVNVIPAYTKGDVVE